MPSLLKKFRRNPKSMSTARVRNIGLKKLVKVDPGGVFGLELPTETAQRLLKEAAEYARQHDLVPVPYMFMNKSNSIPDEYRQRLPIAIESFWPVRPLKTLRYGDFLPYRLQAALFCIFVAGLRPERIQSFYHIAKLSRMVMGDEAWDPDYAQWLEQSQALETERRMRQELTDEENQ